MKLLNVELVLKREEDIQHAEAEYNVIKELGDETTKYAILSHRWESDSEVTYDEMIGLMKMEERKRGEVRISSSYQKIIKTCEQAMKDGYEWVWIDTCCIDKRSSAELSEAINSMYRWYQHARVCYAYLSDVGESTLPAEQNGETYDKSYGWPEWFMRGWTLQELIAPNQIEFFNQNWAPIGNKQQLAPVLEEITRIPCDVLRDGLTGKRLSVAQIMSWAADRRTTRVEDRAYSLMGLFGVNMPMLYGEGKKAFRRLQLEIIREFDDQSVFAWGVWGPLQTRTRAGSFLADDPSDFRGRGDIQKVEPDKFGDKLAEYMKLCGLGSPWFIQLNSRKISTNPIHHCRVAWLKWRARALTQQLRTFTVTNAGIQVCLPVIPLPDSPSHFRAILACTRYGGLADIDIVYSGSGIYCIPNRSVSRLKAYPKFRTLHLAHNQDINEKHRKFTLDDQHALYHGFTRCGTHPHEFTGDTVALSFLVVVYAKENTRYYFAVGLGYYLGQGWVHIVCGEHRPTQDMDWAKFGKKAYDRMWHARAEHARDMSNQERAHLTRNTHFVKHAHFPRSIWPARVVWGRWELGNLRVMVDVVQCPGCCDGPCGMTTTVNDWGGLGMPGLMNTIDQTYSLELDGWKTQVDRCSGPQLSLGDYGDCVEGTLMCTGNIFRDMQLIGIDPEDSAYQPVVSRVSGDRWAKYRVANQTNIATAYHGASDTTSVLHRAKGISLPNNEHFVLLLKAFSTRLAGKHVVTTLIQCSGIYSVDRVGNRIDSGDDVVPYSGMHAAEPGILTPFCVIASPQVWRREPPCVRRREQFENIRKHFYALVDIVRCWGFHLSIVPIQYPQNQPTGHGPCRKLAVRRTMW
ncbi:heterokaryon incompatibility protein-domain-containing protein [Pisolithus albus]|nr:heterokaryon incompatibility protein-domain-containing protein [Pisolithus albus]